MRAWFVLALGACYQPTGEIEGVACSNEGTCPPGQRCFDGVCRREALAGDDALTDTASSDSPLATDAPDAPAIWGTPTKIPGINSASNEGDPSLTSDRLTIVFSSNRSGNEDLFIGTRAVIGDAFVVTALSALNSAMADRSPEISGDGSTLFFTSNRGGNFDVFRSIKVGAAFGAPALVAELNTVALEDDIAVSPDGLTVMVARGNDMYIATRATPTGTFSMPVLVPELDVTGNVAAPSITNGAAVVYLHAGATRDLYVAYRQGVGFTTPIPVAELNTAARDAAPFVSADDRYLAFERAGEIFETTR